ncbi:FG-GAP-like repeat-containing protein [Pelagicoccus mobilis]|uniref:VCBS repeat-containing protein n=1 Tax=Pelagicoccus mobilis TaxID=415221 RepID=A0A934VU53_9BACT|nr:FG-GAP-like repeat-containing protein [Pelagicoccus mobilis]MBK1880403.1 VCBS repeat-containing protein [Pelagicoccus mobilis]
MIFQKRSGALSPQRPIFHFLTATIAAAALALASQLQASFIDSSEVAGMDDFEVVTRTPADFVVRGGTPIVMDFDGNGWLDLYIIRYQLDDLIYLNNEGVFTKTVNPLGLDTKNGGNAGAWADIDNDGDNDMIVAVADAKSHLLYLNNGDGTFTESAAERGLDLTSDHKDHQATAVTVGDINRDGYLDVIMGSWGIDYEEDSRTDYHGLFLNQGASNPGHFTNITEDSGYLFTGEGMVIFAPAITDLDQDGWPDIATTSDYSTSALHWNNATADPSFTNSTTASGVGIANHSMGTAIGDIDNDGDLDWFVTTIAITRDINGEINPLYINQGGRLFQNRSVEAGVSFSGWGWGTNMFDYDLDGDLDIVAVNQEDVTPEGPLDHGRMFLWRNDGNLEFTDVSSVENADQLARAAGIVTFDYNNDGALDIFFINDRTRSPILRNTTPLQNRWLKVELEGTVSNRNGIGALITVQPTEDGASYIREFNPTNAYLAQLSPYVHFGFPSAQTTLHKVTVKWPSGIEQELTDVSTDQLLSITEDDSLLAGDTIPAFTTTPSSQVATRGEPLTLSVSFEENLQPRVTWFRNGALLAGVEGLSITFDNMQPRNAGTYHAVATNSAGSTTSAEFIVGVRSDFTDKNIARQWNELVLDCARINFPDPPIVARTFYHCSAAMWDTFWAYQINGWGDAQHLFQREALSSDDWHGDREASLAEAMSHAVFTVASERYRKGFNNQAILYSLADFMVQRGYDPENLTTDGNSPAAVGNRIGNAILSQALNDGSNEANDYADTNGYAPKNEPLTYGSSGVTLAEPNHWQPLNLPRSVTKNGIELGSEIQQFLAPSWNWVTPFALEKPTDSSILIDPGPQPLFGEDTHVQLIEELIEVVRAASIMDPDQNVIIDMSPGSFQQNNSYLTQDGEGHPINPFTGQAYEENLVNQGDYFRLTAEFWSDGPGIEGPPGVWNMLHNQVSDDPRFERKLGGSGPELSPLEWDVHAYLALNGALHDAAIAAWTIKAKYDSVRPISIIRYVAELGQSSDPNKPNYHADGFPLVPGLIELITEETTAEGQKHAHLKEFIDELALYSWRGVPNNPDETTSGVGWVRAADWAPYHLPTFPTPNFAGYISGHSTFSRAGAEVMSMLTGSAFFPGGIKEFTFPEGEYLNVEYGPSTEVKIQVATYYDAADLTGVARIYCGVHIAADDFVGRKVGARAGVDSVLKTLALRQGQSAPTGLGTTQLALNGPTPRLDYTAPHGLPLRSISSLDQITPESPAGIYFTPGESDQVNITFHQGPVSSIEATAPASPSEPLEFIFRIHSTEPVTLLATGDAGEESTLTAHKLEGAQFSLLSSNRNWIEHPRASLSSIFTNRRDFAGQELDAHSTAIPLQLSSGIYRLQLSPDIAIPESPPSVTLRLEVITDQDM